ncbi:MAG: ligase-associated DNA damage response endonuclease PdeM [Rhodobacteraceae bacterium]|nr:ligase-associated DNA damage response endonuclease PdeM [Paracoccaceae bacterium]
MSCYDFPFASARLTALPSGGLWWSERGILAVSDLHFGKSHRLTRKRSSLLPPHDNQETLTRLEHDILVRNPATIICLGDSFDDLAAVEELDQADHRWLTCLMAGRRWIWIEGNHHPGPVDVGGTHLAEYREAALTFRHIADPDAQAEVSGHFHPKTRIKAMGRSISRPCFLLDDKRLILPAYGAFTGGLRSDAPVLRELMSPNSIAVLTGKLATPVPLEL